MTSNPTTYKRQITFNRGLINFPDFSKFLPKASPLHFFNFPDAEDGDDKSHARRKKFMGLRPGRRAHQILAFCTFEDSVDGVPEPV